MNESGNPIDLSARIYVDDAIMLSSNANHMKMVLAAMIESIFVVMGEPEDQRRTPPMSFGHGQMEGFSYRPTPNRFGIDNRHKPNDGIDPIKIPHRSTSTPGVNLAPI